MGGPWVGSISSPTPFFQRFQFVEVPGKHYIHMNKPQIVLQLSAHSSRAYRGRPLPGYSFGLGSCSLPSLHRIFSTPIPQNRWGGHESHWAWRLRGAAILQQRWGREDWPYVTLRRGLGVW